jgi:hypothetical protein
MPLPVDMPKPLSQLTKGLSKPIEVSTEPGAAAREPELAALVAQIISICSESDYFLGRTLIDMLGPKAAPAFAIYEALAWGYSKKQALKGAAAMSLDDQDYRLFEAILKLYGEDERQRNKFCHWLWCYSEQVTGHVILLDPMESLRWRVALHVGPDKKRVITSTSGSGLGECECYSKSELERLVERFTVTIGLIEVFRNLVGVPGAPKDSLRSSLETQPRMAEALRRLETPNQTLPSEHPEPQQ